MDVDILEPENRGVSAVLSGGHVVSVRFPPCDVLVLQRPTAQRLTECIPFLQAKGTSVVVDFDDDLSNVNPNNVAFASLHPKRDLANNWRWSEVAAQMADLVTVSTPPLAAKYGAHGRVRVLRNCVPDHYLTTEPAGERWSGVGWAGSLHSHPHDLSVVGSAAARLERDGNPFIVIGPGDGVARALGLSNEPEASGLVPFHHWPSAVARLTVAIAPLAATRFNEAKSSWKCLEYAALSVPFVASASSPEYARLIDMGAGVGALKPRDWYRELRALVDSEGLRAERAGRARETVEALTYSRQAEQWADAWADAASNRRKQQPQKV